MRTKIIGLLLTACLIVSLALPAAAAEDAAASFQGTAVRDGNEVTVTLTVDQAGATSGELSLDYDAAALTLKSAEFGEAVQSVLTEDVAHADSINTNEEGTVTAGFAALSASQAGEILVVVFEDEGQTPEEGYTFKYKVSEWSGSDGRNSILDTAAQTSAYIRLEPDGRSRVVVDKSELQALYDEALKLDESEYTSSSWAVLEAAMERAKAVLADEDADQTAVDNAYEALDAAIRSLKEYVDKSELQAVYDFCQTLDEEDYTEESWAGLESAMETAEAVLEDEDATQAEVNDALDALNAAIDGLERLPAVEEPEEPAPETVDKSALQALVEACEDLDEDAYTPETWAVLESALERAQAVLDNEDATAEQVGAAQAQLEAAIAALTEIEQSGDETPEIWTDTVTVTVVDGAGAPITGLTVELHSDVQTAVLDENGTATFYDVEMGVHTLILLDEDGTVLATCQFELEPGDALDVEGNIIYAPNHSLISLTFVYDEGEMVLQSAEETGSSDVDTPEGEDTDTSTDAKTGDSTMPILWVAVLVVCAGGLAVLWVSSRKKHAGRKE